MSLQEKIKLIPRELKSDKRGWFLKVINGFEEGLRNELGEIYLTMALPGEARGNHYHNITNEWFTVIKGEAIVGLQDPLTGECVNFKVCESDPKTIYVPKGIAHVFQNLIDSNQEMVLIAYSDQKYIPEDTISFKINI